LEHKVHYFLRCNQTRTVIGTAKDFEELSKIPRPATDFVDIYPPVEAESWAEAKNLFFRNQPVSED